MSFYTISLKKNEENAYLKCVCVCVKEDEEEKIKWTLV